jgi:nucleotide-binding universal stress UspA family protein
MREGDPAHGIVDAVRHLGADLVVIGTHGRGRLAAAVIGSVAQSVVRTAPCPVIVVSHPLCLPAGHT